MNLFLLNWTHNLILGLDIGFPASFLYCLLIAFQGSQRWPGITVSVAWDIINGWHNFPGLSCPWSSLSKLVFMCQWCLRAWGRPDRNGPYLEWWYHKRKWEHKDEYSYGWYLLRDSIVFLSEKLFPFGWDKGSSIYSAVISSLISS